MNTKDIEGIMFTEDYIGTSLSNEELEMRHQMKLARAKYGPQTRSLPDMDRIHRAMKSTNVSIPVTNMRQQEREYESSDESYTDERIIEVKVIEHKGDNAQTEGKGLQCGSIPDTAQIDTSYKFQKITSSYAPLEEELGRMEETPKDIRKKAKSEGTVKSKNGRVTRFLVALKLKKRATSANPVLQDQNQGSSQTRRPETKLAGAETPLKKTVVLYPEKKSLPLDVEVVPHRGLSERFYTLLCCKAGDRD